MRSIILRLDQWQSGIDPFSIDISRSGDGYPRVVTHEDDATPDDILRASFAPDPFTPRNGKRLVIVPLGIPVKRRIVEEPRYRIESD